MPHQQLVTHQAQRKRSSNGQPKLQRPEQSQVHQQVLQREQQRQVQQVSPVGALRQVLHRRAGAMEQALAGQQAQHGQPDAEDGFQRDRKSTRLNSSN